jgi:hypothetical protein
MTMMDSGLVKHLKKSLPQPLPPWSEGLGRTFLLSAVDSPEPRRVMVNGWGNIQSVFLSEFNTKRTSPLKFPHFFKNNTHPYDRHSALPGRNEERVAGDEDESYNRQSGDSSQSRRDQGSRDTVEASGSANATSAATLGAQNSVESRALTPETESFDEFMHRILSH